jgi:hypothetical protein
VILNSHIYSVALVSDFNVHEWEQSGCNLEADQW